MSSLFIGRHRRILRALAEGFVPETADASRAQWSALEALVEDALAQRTSREHRQLRLFLGVLDWLARFRFGHGLVELDPGRRTDWLERLSLSRWLLIRRGMWGIRTLLMLGWYGQPEVSAALGYRASPAGWGRP